MSLPAEVHNPRTSLFVASHPCVSVGDLHEVACAFDPSINVKDTLPFERHLQAIKREFAPVGSTLGYIGSSALTDSLEARAEQIASSENGSIGVVFLDRYAGLASQNPHHARLQFSRNNQRQIVSRPGSLPQAEQMRGLSRWAMEGAYEEILFVDDVVVSGSTVLTTAAALRESLPNATYLLLAGIAATSDEKDCRSDLEKNAIGVESLFRIHTRQSTEEGHMAMGLTVSRDFTLQGGKAVASDPGRQLVSPYFLPFSVPMPTLVARQSYEASRKFLQFNRMWTEFLKDRLGRDVTIGDAMERGFGVPCTSIEDVAPIMEIPGVEVGLIDYVDYAQGVLDGLRGRYTS